MFSELTHGGEHFIGRLLAQNHVIAPNLAADGVHLQHELGYDREVVAAALKAPSAPWRCRWRTIMLALASTTSASTMLLAAQPYCELRKLRLMERTARN